MIYCVPELVSDTKNIINNIVTTYFTVQLIISQNYKQATITSKDEN